MRSRMAELTERLQRAAGRRTDPGPDSPLAATLAVLAAEYGSAPDPATDAAPGGRPADPLPALGDVFGLDEVDLSLLWAAAAPDLDANVGIAYAHLRGEPGVARCVVALGLELAGVATASAEAFGRLGPGGALRRHRLLDVVGGEPFGQRRLVVADPVLAVLAGAPADDPVLAPLRSTSIPLELPNCDVVAAAIRAGAGLVWIRSVRGAAGASLAAGALRSLAIRAMTIDLRTLAPATPRTDVLAAAAREAGLSGCALVVTNADVLAERVEPADFELLERCAVPVLVVSARAWNPSWLAHLPLVVEAERMEADQRAELWRAELGAIADGDDELHQTLLGLRMNPESIAEAARYARLLALTRAEPLSGATVREAARRVSGSGSAGNDGYVAAGTAGIGLGFADLLLPANATRSLQQLVNWARHRDDVTAPGMLRTGRGLAALFAGNPGTGKTLAANIIAQELSMDLFQVELSAVVDKYIGETEKNLEKVFQAAESLDVVLFFDEADALFGSRSEVHDARDRYANQEIAYLLQRMEQFDGITILATNLRGNLDRAFSRRMSFIVNFPDPDAGIRRRLWQHHLDQLGALDDSDPVQLAFLAESAELTGGDIRNIVRAAAYDAVSAAERVGMRHLTAATLGEYRKLGRILPEHGFVPAGPTERAGT